MRVNHSKQNSNPTVPHLPSAWSYLLAERVSFSKTVPYGIRIKRPSNETLVSWLEKLITCGRCHTIYVENLALSPVDVDTVVLLCQRRGVSLINLSVNAANHEIQLHNLVA